MPEKLEGAEQVNLEANRAAAGEVNVASFEIYERGKTEGEQTLAMEVIAQSWNV